MDPLMSMILGTAVIVGIVAALAVALNQLIQAYITWTKREYKGVDRDRPVQEWDEPTYQSENTQYTQYNEIPPGYYDELGMDPPPRNPGRRGKYKGG